MFLRSLEFRKDNLYIMWREQFFLIFKGIKTVFLCFDCILYNYFILLELIIYYCSKQCFCVFSIQYGVQYSIGVIVCLRESKKSCVGGINICYRNLEKRKIIFDQSDRGNFLNKLSFERQLKFYFFFLEIGKKECIEKCEEKNNSFLFFYY